MEEKEVAGCVRHTKDARVNFGGNLLGTLQNLEGFAHLPEQKQVKQNETNLRSL